MMIHVKPVNGATIPNPDNGFKDLAEGGEQVLRTQYWLSRIKDGGVEEISKPAPVAVPASTPVAQPVKKKAPDGGVK